MSTRITSNRRVAKQIYDFFLVVDFEATCLQNAKILPCQEIIEFPVAKLNANTLEVDSIFHKYVRPTVNPSLSPFCTHLTGIIQEMVDNADPLPEVLRSFDEWIARERLTDAKFVFVSCGDWDLKVMLPSESAYKQLHLPRYFSEYVNVKKSFCELTGTFPKSMTDILNHIGTTLKGRHHSGIDDVKNIVEIAKWLIRENHIITPHSSSVRRRFGASLMK